MSKNQKRKDFSNQRFRDRLLGRINEFYKNADDVVVSQKFYYFISLKIQNLEETARYMK